MILFFDTETTGLPDYNKRARDPSQPHIVQLACALVGDDGEIIETYDRIARPDGWAIPPEVSEIHGITNAVAFRDGIPEIEIAEHFFKQVKLSSLMVAHNIKFDKYIARIALRRFEIFTDAEDAWWKSFPTFCTMRSMTDICAIPSPRGMGFKYPKLEEAFMTAFAKLPPKSHIAGNDLKACMEIYFWLKQNHPDVAAKVHQNSATRPITAA